MVPIPASNVEREPGRKLVSTIRMVNPVIITLLSSNNQARNKEIAMAGMASSEIVLLVIGLIENKNKA